MLCYVIFFLILKENHFDSFLEKIRKKRKGKRKEKWNSDSKKKKPPYSCVFFHLPIKSKK